MFDSFSNSYWSIVNSQNGAALVVNSSGASQEAVNSTDKSEQFQVLYDYSNGCFHLIDRSSGLSLTGQGTQVVEAAYAGTGNSSQQWALGSDGSGHYRIFNLSNFLVLQTDGQSPAHVTLASNSSDARQLWSINLQASYSQKGVVGESNLTTFDAGWNYNYGLSPSGPNPAGDVYYPMAYADWTADGISAVSSAWHSLPQSPMLLGYNEPDQSRPTGANMTVAQAIQAWPKLLNAGVPLVSPAPANSADGWLGSFYAQASSLGYRVDYTGVHDYSPPNAAALMSKLYSIYQTYGRPVYLTEFGNVDWGANQTWTEESQYRFLAEFMWDAAGSPWLKGYAMFPIAENEVAQPWTILSPSPSSAIYLADGTTLTALGRLYAAWDGNTTVQMQRAYTLYNNGASLFMTNHGTDSSPNADTIRDTGTRTQWEFVAAPTPGQFYIVSLKDGRRLSANGTVPTFNPAGDTSTQSRWAYANAGNGYNYIWNVATGQRLSLNRVNDASNNPTGIWFSMSPGNTTAASAMWRFIEPYQPVNTTSVPAVWSSSVPGFTGRDIGSPASAGFSTFDTNTGLWTVSGGGTDIWGTGDQFYFESASYAGDGTIIARVTSVQNTSDSSKAGVMFRDSSDPDSANAAFADVFLKPNTIGFEYRSVTGGNVAVSAYVTGSAPEWVRLVRSGDTFTACYSADGINWTQLGARQTIVMSSVAAVGLAVTAHNNSALNTSTFSNVAISSPGWSNSDIGSPTSSGFAMKDALDHRTVAGGGSDIWGTSDQFSFTSQTMNGDGLIAARIDSETNTDPWAKAGVMLRNDATAQSAFAMVALTPSNGLIFEWRPWGWGNVSAATVAGVGPNVWVKLVRTGNTISAWYSSNGYNWSQIGSAQAVAMNNSALAGFAVTSHNNALLNIATFDAVSIVPAGSSDSDIGSPGLIGSARFTPETGSWSVTGGGSDIWGTSDQFNFASQGLVGDGSIVARVASITNTSASAKAGLMFRSDLTAGSAFANVDVTAANGVVFQWRATAGAAATNVVVGGVSAPRWIKLTRAGSSFSGYYSADGVAWTQIGASQSVALSATAQVGLSVSAGNNAALNTATFTNVAIQGWSDGDIGAPGRAGSAGYNGASGVWTVSGGGSDIWNNADQFHLTSQALAGDGSVVALVGSITNTNAYAKAGVMIRNDDSAGAAFADVVLTAANSVSFQWRAAAGAAANAVYVNGIVGAPVWVRLNRAGGNFTAAYSYDGVYWNEIGGSQAVAIGAVAQAGLAVSAVNNAALNTATFTHVALLPVGWSDADIGSPGVPGTAMFDGANWTVQGGGSDIWGNSDQFHFASQTFVGDATIIAKVNSLTNTGNYAKTGVMIRDGAAANAAYAFLFVTPNNGVAFEGANFEFRGGAGAASQGAGATPGVAAPQWLKLVRAASTFTAYYSTDGTTWIPDGSQSISMSPTVNVGLAVSANNNAALNTATFTSVSVLPTGWSDADIGSPGAAGSANFDGLTWSVRGGGADIWGTSDQFNFASRSFTGDATIVAQVGGMLNTANFAKAGLMIRDGSAASASYAFAFVTPNNGIAFEGANFEYRNGAGAAAQGAASTAGITAPEWLKLVRAGNVFTAFYSADGQSWTQNGGSVSIVMSPTVRVGMAVDANSATGLNAATFANVAVGTSVVDPYLAQSGTSFRNGHGTGDAVTLRGTNLGSWLMYEPGFGGMGWNAGDEPDTIYNSLVGRFDIAGANRVQDAYEFNWITTQDLDKIKSLGFSVVRVGFSYLNLVEPDGAWRADAFTHLDWVVNEAWKRGIYVILDFHGIRGGTSTYASSGSSEAGAFWTNTGYQQETVNIWAQIAAHFKGNPAVASYELMNEPAAAPSSTALANMYNTLYWTVHNIDPGHIVQFDAFPSWDALPNPASYGWTNIVYQMHPYGYDAATNSIANPTTPEVQGAADWAVSQFNTYASYNIPNFIGEFSGNGDANSIRYETQTFDQHAFGWTDWTWKHAFGYQGTAWGVYVPVTGVWIPDLHADSLNTILTAYATQVSAASFQFNAYMQHLLGMPAAADDAYVVAPGVSLYVNPATGVLANDTDLNLGQPGIQLSTNLVSGPAHGTLTLWADGSFYYTPAAGFVGADTFRYKVQDGYIDSATTAVVNLVVTTINHAPSFVKGANQSVNSTAGPRSIAGWATNISPGAGDDPAQAVNFVVSNSNPSLFSAPPSIAPNGTLTFTPAASAGGSATVSVWLHDAGGTDNGGVDLSTAQTFTIVVLPVNLHVTTIADSGAGSLRQAILDANANQTTAHTIYFDMAGGGSYRVPLGSSWPAISGAATLRVDAGISVELAGPSALALAAGATLTKDGAGTLSVTAPQSNAAGSVWSAVAGTFNFSTDAGSNLTVNANAAVNFTGTQHLAALNIGPNTVVTLTRPAGATQQVLVAGALSLTSSSDLDLKDNSLVVHGGGNPAGTFATVEAAIKSAFNNFNLNGHGIKSSTIVDPTVTGLGSALNSLLAATFAPLDSINGEPLALSDTIVRYTYMGDATLDGVVNDDDASLIGGLYDNGANSGHHWFEGDFTHDGLINDDDVSIISGNYNPSAPPLAPASQLDAQRVAAATDLYAPGDLDEGLVDLLAANASPLGRAKPGRPF